MNILRAIRRWWAKWNHKHEYDVIWQGMVLYEGCDYWRVPVILERCSCGHERAKMRRWQKWDDYDIDLLNFQFREKNIEVPARHQE